MNIDGAVLGIFKSAEEFEFSVPEEQLDWCTFAQEFSKWADRLCQVTENPTVIAINQAKLLLLDKYFEWRSFVPKSHRNRLGDRGHTCIFQVFVQAYERLKVVELSLTPPMLFLPPPQQIAGLFLGELDEE